MTVNKMLHDGLVRDTQLDHAPSQRSVRRPLCLCMRLRARRSHAACLWRRDWHRQSLRAAKTVVWGLPGAVHGRDADMQMTRGCLHLSTWAPVRARTNSMIKRIHAWSASRHSGF